jgi:hypothetical protein
MEVIIDFLEDGDVKNEMTGAEAGIELVNYAEIKGSGTLINEGRLVFTEGALVGTMLINQGGSEGPVVFEGGNNIRRFIDGRFINAAEAEGENERGVVTQKANVVVGPDGTLENCGIYTIEGSAKILDLTLGGRETPLFRNIGEEGLLLKTGEGRAEIQGHFELVGGGEVLFNDAGETTGLRAKGGIRVEGGSLTLSGGGALHSEPFDATRAIPAWVTLWMAEISP